MVYGISSQCSIKQCAQRSNCKKMAKTVKWHNNKRLRDSSSGQCINYLTICKTENFSNWKCIKNVIKLMILRAEKWWKYNQLYSVSSLCTWRMRIEWLQYWFAKAFNHLYLFYLLYLFNNILFLIATKNSDCNLSFISWSSFVMFFLKDKSNETNETTSKFITYLRPASIAKRLYITHIHSFIYLKEKKLKP